MHWTFICLLADRKRINEGCILASMMSANRLSADGEFETARKMSRVILSLFPASLFSFSGNPLNTFPKKYPIAERIAHNECFEVRKPPPEATVVDRKASEGVNVRKGD